MCYAWVEGGSAARAPFLKNSFFHFRALLTEEIKKEHAHINGGGFNKLATCLLFVFHYESGLVLKIVFEKYFFVGLFFSVFFIFHFEHFSQKKWKKNTRTSTVAAVTSLPRVCFFIFHYESGLVLKIVFEKSNLVCISPVFFIFHFRALLTEKMENEHAHINGGGCNKLATCSLFHFPLREWPRFENHF
jgi:hypothetical protein